MSSGRIITLGRKRQGIFYTWEQDIVRNNNWEGMVVFSPLFLPYTNPYYIRDAAMKSWPRELCCQT
jgi:hypothetical protein